MSEAEQEAMKEFDVIILGTGVKECVLSGLLSSLKLPPGADDAKNKKVLVLDRNSYYGGESASLNLDQLFKKFRGEEAKVDTDKLGRSRDYCLDLCPKFLMACGDLVRILLLTKVTDYLEFKSVEGSYVMKNNGKVYKCPATPAEALSSSLMGMFEKRRFKKFLDFVSKFEDDKKETYAAVEKNGSLKDMTALQLLAHFGLDDNTMSFTGHAIALFTDDTYLSGSALDLIERTQLYAFSVAKYGKSPYIYPKWGLGGLPEGFSRRCAVHGGTFMLNMNEEPNFIKNINFGGDGKVEGIELSENVSKCYEIPQNIKCKQLIADPSYFVGTDHAEKVKKIGEIVRCIVILNQPVRDCKGDSTQVIIPAMSLDKTEFKRKSDIYICSVSYAHNVCAEGKYVAVISANVENADHMKDLEPALALMENVIEKFVWKSEVYEPVGNGSEDNCFITKSYDATTHFQTCSQEIIELYKAVTGHELDLTAEPEQTVEG